MAIHQKLAQIVVYKFVKFDSIIRLAAGLELQRTQFADDGPISAFLSRVTQALSYGCQQLMHATHGDRPTA